MEKGAFGGNAIGGVFALRLNWVRQAGRLGPSRTTSRGWSIPGQDAHFSPDGTLILTAFGNTGDQFPNQNLPEFQTTVSRIDTGSRLWQSTREWPHRDGSVGSWEFSPDNAHLLAVEIQHLYRGGDLKDAYSTICIYDARSGKLEQKFAVNAIRSAHYVDGGRKIFCNGEPSKILDAHTGAVLATTNATCAWNHAPQFTSDGRWGVVTQPDKSKTDLSYSFEIWDFSVPKLVRSIPSSAGAAIAYFSDAAVSPNGNLVCTCEWPHRGAIVRDRSTGRRLCAIPGISPITLEFSPDGRNLLFYKTVRSSPKIGAASELVLYDCQSWKRKWTATPELSPDKRVRFFSNARFSADSRHVVAASVGHGLQWLDVKTGHVVFRQEGDDVVFSPDGKTMAVTTRNSLEIQPVPALPGASHN